MSKISELRKIIEIGYSRRLVGFEQQPPWITQNTEKQNFSIKTFLSKKIISTKKIETIFRRAVLIQLIAHCGGICSQTLENMTIKQLEQYLQQKHPTSQALTTEFLLENIKTILNI